MTTPTPPNALADEIERQAHNWTSGRSATVLLKVPQWETIVAALRHSTPGEAEVARAIDPDAFLLDVTGYPGAQVSRQEKALERARAVLALFTTPEPTSPAAGDGEGLVEELYRWSSPSHMGQLVKKAADALATLTRELAEAREESERLKRVGMHRETVALAQAQDWRAEAEKATRELAKARAEIAALTHDNDRCRAALIAAEEAGCGDPDKEQLLCGARAIGRTIDWDNHIERARETWRAMHERDRGATPSGRAARALLTPKETSDATD